MARLSGQELTEGQANRRLIDMRAQLDQLDPKREARLLAEIAAYDAEIASLEQRLNVALAQLAQSRAGETAEVIVELQGK